MELKCFACSKFAKYIFWGKSLCEEHFVEQVVETTEMREKHKQLLKRKK